MGTFLPWSGCMTSPAFDTTGLDEVSFSFWRWLGSDAPPDMISTVDVWNGFGWLNHYSSTGIVADSSWVFVEFDITAIKNADTQMMWCFEVGSADLANCSGWNVDDVMLGPPGCVPEP
jgi:hypothetical protein